MVILIITGSTFSRGTIENEIQITAHRGAMNKAPENSISSIKQAISDGADYVEIDVKITKDNVVVLFHDSTLKRIDGSKRKIKDMDLEEVKKVDNGSYFSEDFSDEKIPTLEEVLKLCKNKIKLNIELKPDNLNDDLPEKVAKLIEEYNMCDDVVVSSFKYEAIKKFKQFNPKVRIGYIICSHNNYFGKLDVDFLSVEYDMLSKPFVCFLHIIGKEVYVWTIRDKSSAEKVIELNVDNIITDNVDMVRDVMNN